MKLRSPAIIAIIAILAVLGAIGAISLRSGGAVTPTAIYAGESAYAVALTGADTYRHLCVGDPATHAAAVLPVSCKATLATIQADVKVTDSAYQKIKGYENNPPAGYAAEFLAALAVLQSAIPLT